MNPEQVVPWDDFFFKVREVCEKLGCQSEFFGNRNSQYPPSYSTFTSEYPHTSHTHTPINVHFPRENIDTQAASRDGRATLYTNDQEHMFGRKVVIKKQRGDFKCKKKNLFVLLLRKGVFEHVYISTLPHSYTVVKQYKQLTTKILSITFLTLVFLTIHLGDHVSVNVLITLIVISQFLIKLFTSVLKASYTVSCASPRIISV